MKLLGSEVLDKVSGFKWFERMGRGFLRGDRVELRCKKRKKVLLHLKVKWQQKIMFAYYLKECCDYLL
jgi:hypothetical protein